MALMRWAFTEGLRIHNNLVLLIHGSHTVVALYGAFAGEHLGTFVIRDITFYFFFVLGPYLSCCALGSYRTYQRRCLAY